MTDWQQVQAEAEKIFKEAEADEITKDMQIPTNLREMLLKSIAEFDKK